VATAAELTAGDKNQNFVKHQVSRITNVINVA